MESVTLTAAQVTLLNTTPVTLVAAPGAGKALMLLDAVLFLDYATTAYDGIAALDLCTTERPDLVLLDLMMPMMSGYEVCEQIKANPLTKNIPVLCISSAHTPEARAQCFRAGAAELLKKPFFPAELVAQIGRHLKASDDLI